MEDRCRFLVGASQPDKKTDQELYTLKPIEYRYGHLVQYQSPLRWRPSALMPLSLPMCPTLVGNEVACITPPSGVMLFNTTSYHWTNSHPLLNAATSMAVLSNRNLVVQTNDSIQIFSFDVLTTGGACKDIHPSHIYPLGEKHIICILQPDRHLTLLDLETLQELPPDNNVSPLRSPIMNNPSSIHGSIDHRLVAEFGVEVVIQAWQSGTPLPEWTEVVEEGTQLSRLSPECTWIVTVYGSPQQELCVKDIKNGIVLVNVSLEGSYLGTGEVYDITFDSETQFYLKVDRPGWHVQIPHDIIPSQSGQYSHTIMQGEPVPLLEP